MYIDALILVSVALQKCQVSVDAQCACQWILVSAGNWTRVYNGLERHRLYRSATKTS